MSDADTTITCRESTYMVCGARDEALSDAQLRLLHGHLQGCDACRVASKQFAQLFEQMDVLFARDEQVDAP